jgi:hypothetical protein
MSRQHPIDLLPKAIYAQSQAGLRMGRFGGASAVVIVMLVVAATHSRIVLRNAQIDKYNISAQATQVSEIDARAATLRRALNDIHKFTEVYNKAAFPLDMSAILATVIHKLTPSVTLDQIDLNAGTRQGARTPRSKGAAAKDEPAPPRVLNGELSGFAATDQHIAELVSRLRSTPPFRDVSLDFSRTRDVRGVSAREFRLSFRIDLDATYIINPDPADRAATAAAGASIKEE